MNYFSQIQELEEKKQLLLKKRKAQILAIIEKSNALDIDDKLLAKTLFCLKNSTDIVAQVNQYAESKDFRPPSPARSKNKKSTQKNN